MSTDSPSEAVGIVAAVAVLLGVSVVVSGLLLVTSSPLGGFWIVAIGLSLLLSGAVVTPSLADRLRVPTAVRRRLSLAFVAIALALVVAFVVVNAGSFGAGESAGQRGG